MTQSLKNIARILMCLSKGTNRFTDICTEVHLPRSTVHGLLNSMIESEFAMQDFTNRHYHLGPLILSLIHNPITPQRSLYLNAHDELRRLRDRSRETVAIHTMMGIYKICLEEIESPERIKYVTRKGEISCSYLGASGKMLLAQIKEDELKILIGKIKQSDKGKIFNHDMNSILKQLKIIREQGCAESVGSHTPGAAAISIPILNVNYLYPLSLSILAPEHRFKKNRTNFLRWLQQTSKQISKNFK